MEDSEPTQTEQNLKEDPKINNEQKKETLSKNVKNTIKRLINKDDKKTDIGGEKKTITC